jgi:hypothetical protein
MEGWRDGGRRDREWGDGLEARVERWKERKREQRGGPHTRLGNREQNFDKFFSER